LMEETEGPRENHDLSKVTDKLFTECCIEYTHYISNDRHR
jgi:hypothetical protein